LKILVVLESYYPNIGGVEELFQSLCEGLVRHGHAVTVFTTHEPSQHAHTFVNGVEVRRLRFRSRYGFSLFSLPTLCRLSIDCDVMLTTSYNAALPAWVAARWRHKKIVVTFHEVWGDLWFSLPFMGRIRKYGHSLFERLLLRLPFDRFVAPSLATAHRLKAYGVEPTRIAHIYNGVDYAAFEGHTHSPPEVFTYCYFGRLGISKGLDILLPAASRFAMRYPESRLDLIVPTKPAGQFKKITKLIRRYNLTPHLRLRHNLSRSAILHAVSQAHCVVIPSYSEGFCFAAVEAVALGVPVIVSNRGALPEVVSGKHLVMTDLTPDALYDALVQAMRGAWSSTPIKRFPMENTLEEYRRLIEGML